MGKCGNHAEYLRALDEITVNLFRFGLGQSRWPRIALVRAVHVFCKEKTMSNSDKVWPTGLTEAESEEIHRNLIQGTQIFGMIAAFAHLLAYIYSPWLK